MQFLNAQKLLEDSLSIHSSECKSDQLDQESKDLHYCIIHLQDELKDVLCRPRTLAKDERRREASKGFDEAGA